MTLLALQTLNGLQYGMVLFLVAGGLTLVFGVMDFINLAHGVQFTLGACFAATFTALTGSFALGVVLAMVAALVVGLVLELLVFRVLARRSHLEQVLGTFGVILCATDLLRLVYGSAPLSLPLPQAMSGTVHLTQTLAYPVWRIVIIAAGLAVAVLLWLLMARTRLGMLVRAGSTDRETVAALGINIDRLFLMIFVWGAVLAAFAGAMAGPLISIEPNMGDNVLILAFVVIVIGGIGSVRGAFVAALVIGLVDTLGRAFATDLLKLVMSNSSASAAGPALASMLVYVLMALVLVMRPSGLFASSPR